MFPSDLAAAAGTPSNLGRVGAGTAAALADVDPLGVNQNVTFDEVGGLDEHIASLKEMTLLPLLYPELFQRFNVTPPRGVLFHGPPGTGKTLLARALAASCRSGGRQIAFFMRKGADCLSKWVGEAERQLRLLFEEARASQPAIIFFDEIDGLAPVRSAKQDQIHASIVSTLLALMDGMDGRGQVIVIGATNRPDAIDPALRRPGRFDREFSFSLPDVAAREQIHTKGWGGWEDEHATIKGLATIAKGRLAALGHETLALLVPASLAEYGAFFFPLATAAGDHARSAPPPSLSLSLPRHPIHFTPFSSHVHSVSLSVPLHTPYGPLPTLLRHSPHEPVPPILLAPTPVESPQRARPATLARLAAGIAFAYARCRVLLAARHTFLARVGHPAHLHRPIVSPPVATSF
ncbi:AAA-domain-containing protein [Auricularia subglabra TFB-10046 SS5]|nr:AAA-domain-containing protein [Auricularia subglabra TFB-10046 SS5]